MVAAVTPVITIDQTGLSAGVAGESRADLVPGQLVTIGISPTSQYSPADTNRYAARVLSVEPTSDTAPVLVQVTNTSFAFTPTAAAYGRTYRIEVTVDGGTEYEMTVVRTLSIRTANQNWRLPAPGERASSAATLQNMGSDQVGLSETNANASPWGWHDGQTKALRSMDTLVGWMALNAAVFSPTPAVISYIQLDPGTWTFDAITDKSGTGVSFTTEIYDVTGAAVVETATYNAAATAVAIRPAAGTFVVATAGLYAIRAAASSGTGTLHSIRIRGA